MPPRSFAPRPRSVEKRSELKDALEAARALGPRTPAKAPSAHSLQEQTHSLLRAIADDLRDLTPATGSGVAVDADVRFLSAKFHAMMERLHEEEARRREAESRDRDTSEALRLLREQNANEGQRLRTEVEGLRTQNGMLISRLNELKRDAETTAGEKARSSAQEDQLTQRLSALTEKCGELSETKRLLKAASAEAEEKLAAAQGEIAGLRAQAQDLTEQLRAANAEGAKTAAKTKQRAEKFRAMEQRTAELEKEKVAAAEREQAVTAEARAARKQLAACKEKLAEARGDAEAAVSRLEKREAQLGQLRQESVKKDHKVHALSRKFEAVQGVEARVARILSDDDDLRKRLATESEAKLAALSEAAQAATTAQQLRTQLAAVESDYALREAEVRELRSANDDLEVKAARREREAAQLAMEHAAVKTDEQSAAGELQAEQEAHRCVRHELERRTEELAALREKAGAAAHAADTARSSARTAEAQKMSLEKELESERRLRTRAQRETVLLQEKLRAARKREANAREQAPTPGRAASLGRSAGRGRPTSARKVPAADLDDGVGGLQLLRAYVEKESAKLGWSTDEVSRAAPTPTPGTPPAPSPQNVSHLSASPGVPSPRRARPQPTPKDDVRHRTPTSDGDSVRIGASQDLGELLARTPASLHLPPGAAQTPST